MTQGPIGVYDQTGPAEGGPERPLDDRPITALLSDLATESASLVRKEVELAKAELAEKAGQAGRGVFSIAVGLAIILLGLIFIIQAAVYALDLILPAWAAALIVGVAIAVIGLLLLRSGFSALSPSNLQPRRTVETIKDDARWVKAQASGS